MRILALFFAMLSASCAATSNEKSLYETYKSYVSALESQEFDTVTEEMISRRNRDDALATQESFIERFPVLAMFPDALRQETEHFEVVIDNTGCLTVNGWDSGYEPTALNMKYLKESGHWKIDYVEVAYLESESDFSNEAQCPERPE